MKVRVKFNEIGWQILFISDKWTYGLRIQWSDNEVQVNSYFWFLMIFIFSAHKYHLQACAFLGH